MPDSQGTNSNKQIAYELLSLIGRVAIGRVEPIAFIDVEELRRMAETGMGDSFHSCIDDLIDSYSRRHSK